MTVKLVSLLLAALLVLTGCIGTQQDGPDGEARAPTQAVYDRIEAEIGAPIVEDHEHEDAGAHGGSYNLERMALVDGFGDGEAPASTVYFQTAVQGDHAYLTRNGPESGLVIFDISDPSAPEQVGFLKLEAGFEPDVEISADGNWAFWETQRFPTSAETPSVTEPGANLHRGVHIVDISDKSDPTWEGYFPTWPDGPHSITYAKIDGRHILFQSVYAFAYAYGGVDVPMAQRLVISELDTSGPVATLETLAEYRLPQAQGNLGQMPHDVSVYEHPVTGQTLAYVAYWNQGAVILDVGEPANPELVGHYTDFGPAPYAAIHMVRQFPHTIDGRVVAVAEPEIGGQPDSGYITFFDVTDPSEPTYISSWRLPGNLTSAGGTLGPHYFDVADGRVALASYHAGLWVIDVHDATNLADPRTVAYAEYKETGGGPATPVAFGAAPSAFDAWWHDGLIVAGNVHGGLAIYDYTGPAPAPE